MMNKSSIFVASLLSVLPSISSAAAFYHEFGFATEPEQELWTVTTGTYGASTNVPDVNFTPTGFEITRTIFGNQASLQVDETRIGQVSILTSIDAPSGYVFTDFRAMLDAWVYPAWGTNVQLTLSANGTDFLASANVPSTGGRYPGVAVEIAQPLDGGGSPLAEFDALSRIWMRVTIMDGYGFIISDNDHPRVQNIVFESELVAVPEPAFLSVLGAGGLLLMRRRK